MVFFSITNSTHLMRPLAEIIVKKVSEALPEKFKYIYLLQTSSWTVDTSSRNSVMNTTDDMG